MNITPSLVLSTSA